MWCFPCNTQQECKNGVNKESGIQNAEGKKKNTKPVHKSVFVYKNG